MRRTLLFVLAAGCSLAQPGEQAQREAVGTVERYIRLRLAGARWVAFKPLIAWEDEPGWDCNWLVNGYSVGPAKTKGDTVTVPVTYDRLGIYCHDFTFKPENRKVTLRYKVAKSSSSWKIRAPEPNPPDLALDVQIEALQTASRNPHDTTEHRKQAQAMVQRLLALKNRKQE